MDKQAIGIAELLLTWGSGDCGLRIDDARRPKTAQSDF